MIGYDSKEIIKIAIPSFSISKRLFSDSKYHLKQLFACSVISGVGTKNVLKGFSPNFTTLPIFVSIFLVNISISRHEISNEKCLKLGHGHPSMVVLQ